MCYGAEVLVVTCVCELIHCFQLCSVLLEVCIHLSLYVLYIDNFTIDDQWLLTDVVMDTYIVDRMCFLHIHSLE
jgi:hypothetical protein